MKLRSGKEMDNQQPQNTQGDMSGDTNPSTSTPQIDLNAFLQQISAKIDQAQAITNANISKLEQAQTATNMKIDQAQSITNANILKLEQALVQTNEKIEKSLEDMNEKLQNTQSQMVNFIKKEIDNLDEKFTQKYSLYKDKIAETVKQDLLHFHDDVFEEVNKTISPLNDKLSSVEAEVKNLKSVRPEKIEVIVSQTNFKTEVERFDGNTKIQNPKTFVKSLREQYGDTIEWEQLKIKIRASLKGDAETWFDLQSYKFHNFEEFEEAFLNYFWGDFTQSKIRENLFFGKYDENYNVSRERYAMRKYNVAKNLEPPMENADIIKYIARHFEEDIRNVIAIQNIDTIEKLLEYLRRIDDIKRLKRKPVVRQTNYMENNNTRWMEGSAGRRNEEKTSSSNSRDEGRRQSDWTDKNYRRENTQKYENRKYEDTKEKKNYENHPERRNCSPRREGNRSGKNYGKRQDYRS